MPAARTEDRRVAPRLSLHPIELPLKHAFTIARGSRSVAKSIVFRLRWDAIEALGESAPIQRYGESFATIEEHFRARPLEDATPYALERHLEGRPPAARCGLDVALHDAIGKDLGRPLWQLFGLDPSRTPTTAFTIGIDSLEATVMKVREVAHHPILKLKLGTGSEIETVEAVRSAYRGTLWIDANEGWTARAGCSASPGARALRC